MNYSEQLEKRNDLLEEANKVMENYMEIADDLFDQYVDQYVQIINIDIGDTGISYHFHIDSYDYSKGTDDFFVSKEKIESLVEKHKQKIRKRKLKQFVI